MNTPMNLILKLTLLFAILSTASYSCASSQGTTKMTKEQAIELAQNKAKEMKYFIQDHKTTTEETTEIWTVSFYPSDPDSLGGGLVVVIDKATGEILSAKRQQ